MSSDIKLKFGRKIFCEELHIKFDYDMVDLIFGELLSCVQNSVF